MVGRAWVFGANVNTDLIFPKTFFKASYGPGEMAKHLMAGIDPDFAAKVAPGDILVGGPNFGCGSSREEAAAAMREAGIAAVVAPGFGRLFMRNAINLGLPAVTAPDVHRHVSPGDRLELDLGAGTLRNVSTGTTLSIPPIAEEFLRLIEDGGIAAYTRKILAERREKERRNGQAGATPDAV